MYVDTDSKNSSRYLLHLSQSGIGLPDESYFRDEQHAEILAAYPGHIAAMFALALGGTTDDHAGTAASIVALETKIAAAHWDVVKRRDADRRRRHVVTERKPRKQVRAGKDELAENPRSRSATLRSAVRTSAPAWNDEGGAR